MHDIRRNLLERTRGLLTFGAALMATALTFFLVSTFAPKQSYVHALFLERGSIQYATTMSFWLTIAILAIMHVASYYEEASLSAARQILESPALDSSFIWADAEMIRGRFSDEKYARYHGSITFRRILIALDRLRKSQSTSALEGYFRTRSDHDASRLETSYAGIRFLVWLLPTLGLIGTVLGLGLGMSKFGGIIAHAENFQAIKSALPDVTGNLGTAFDATFLAILLSAVASFYMSLVQKREEHILEAIDNLCIDDLSSLFQEHSTASAELVRALVDQVELLIKASNGNRAQIERDIERLPEALVSRLEALVTRALGHIEPIARPASYPRLLTGGDLQVAQSQQAGPSGGIPAERLDALERSVSVWLERIDQHASGLATGQTLMTEQLAGELVEIKEALRHGIGEIVALRTEAAPALRSSPRRP
jgi:biopolymer transport protein ExbB/TolQ